MLCWLKIPAAAQITPDTSLGSESSTRLPTNVIEGGARRGANLFHSFSDFNISDGQRIDFANPAGVDRIFARVTGGTRSQIFGTLGILGSANLFLINPNGIFFGPNARLDISGSFVASTADRLIFDNGEFSATTPQAPPLLTISAPIGLQYRDRPGAIEVQGATLEVQPNQRLALLGGDVSLEGALLESPGGQIELTGQNILLQESRLIGGLGLQATPNATAGDIILSAADRLSLNASSLSNSILSAGNGGDIRLNAGSLSITDNSLISTNTIGQGNGGEIAIQVRDKTVLEGSSIASQVGFGAVGNAGDITIETGSFALIDQFSFSEEQGIRGEAFVDASTEGQGNAGKITIVAQDAVLIDGGRISSVIGIDSIGNSNDINITARSVELKRGARLQTFNLGQGNGGDIAIQVRDNTVLENSNIASQVGFGAVGNAGDITIETGSFALVASTGGEFESFLGETFMDASTGGRGNAGKITIAAEDAVLLNGGRISSFIGIDSNGNGNDINITARSVELKRRFALQTFSLGQGSAGNIIIASETFTSTGGDIVSTLGADAQGSGGNVSIAANSLTFTDDSIIDSLTFGRSNAGSVRLQGRDRIVFDQSDISTEVRPVEDGALTQGNGGDITISTNQLTLARGSQLSTSTSSIGRAGDLNVVANAAIDLSGTRQVFDEQGDLVEQRSGLIASTDGPGSAGTIRLKTDQFVIRDRAEIGVSSTSDGATGNLEISANSLRLDQGRITAESASNSGGNLSFNLENVLLLRRGSSISTTAGRAQGGGNGGNITMASGFVLAVPSENSTITANAFRGNGGNIAITTQGIYGFELGGCSAVAPCAKRQTNLSKITASSQFGIDGTVSINNLALNPVQSIGELPIRFSSPSIAQGCQVSSRTARFVNQGRGGLSPSPADPLIAETIWQDWGLIDQPQANRPVEAQGWVKQSDGTVALVVHLDRALNDCPVLQPVP